MTKNAKFGQNLVVFWQKLLIFTGESKSFGTQITEKPPRHLVCIVFWAWDEMGQKMPLFGKKKHFGPNLAVYGLKILILWE